MRLLKSFAPVIFSTIIFYSCNPCNNVDCPWNSYEVQLRIVRATDGTDLVFGLNRIYDKNQIKFYSFKGTDTTLFNYQVLKPLGYDSFLLVRFFPIPDLAYMRLSNGDIDTFQISTKTYNASRCCGAVTQLSNFRFNNGIDYSVAPGGVNIQEIKK